MTLLKGIVLLLVLANVGYFLWARGIAGEPPAAGEAVRAPTLKLASEVPMAARGTAGTDALAAGAQMPGSLKPATAEAAPATMASAATPAVTAMPVVAGTPTPGLPAADIPAASHCVSVGPFRDVAEAARSAATLRGGGYEPRQRVAEGEVWAGVWVYLPAPATRAASDQVLAKLRSGGIDDALEMPGPNDMPVISLGLFSEPKRAQARVAQAQSLGLNPGIADRRRTGDVYWIDIDMKPTDSPINPADLQGDSRRILRLQVSACPVSPS
jgi:hypothetical protein